MNQSSTLPFWQSQIEMRDPNSLRPYSGNARTHSPKKLRSPKAFAASAL